MPSASATAPCNGVIARPAAGSRGLGRIELGLEARHLIAQQQAALLQPTHGKLVADRITAGTVDQAVEISVLDAQLDQATREGMKIVVLRRSDYVADFGDWVKCGAIIVLGL